MDLLLKGKRALVTGSSRGLGYATACGLALEGCDVVINSRNQESLEATAKGLRDETGASVYPVSGDVSDTRVADELVRRAADTLDGIDLLFTNTGGPPPGKFESFDEQTWQSAIDLVLMSHVRLIRAALPYLRKSTAPSVLTLTSYSIKQPIPNLVLSNAVRAATAGLIKSLALDLGSEGIRFNSILPAWIETERVKELMQARASANGTSFAEEYALQAKESVFNRMGTPEEFANAAVFLLSPAASYITGVMLLVDGGMYKGTW